VIKQIRTTSVSNGRFSIKSMLTAEKRPAADEQLKEGRKSKEDVP
jgi:hypothetical protein